MVFVADDLGAWLIGLLADGSRKRLTDVMLGSDQQRALRRAARTAISSPQRNCAQMVRDQISWRWWSARSSVHRCRTCPSRADHVVGGTAGRYRRATRSLDDPRLTGRGILPELLGVPAALLAKKLTSHLVREIVSAVPAAGRWRPLAAQLNSDKAHLQGQRIEDILGRLDNEVRKALALLDTTHSMAAAPVALAQLPNVTAGFTGREGELAELLACWTRPSIAAGSRLSGCGTSRGGQDDTSGRGGAAVSIVAGSRAACCSLTCTAMTTGVWNRGRRWMLCFEHWESAPRISRQAWRSGPGCTGRSGRG